jgi:hypothetical protein
VTRVLAGLYQHAAEVDQRFRGGMDHDAALEYAPKTELPIRERAREICRTMAKGWRGR